MDAIIVTGGRGPDRSVVESYAAADARIVAADSGYDLALSLGLDVDLVIGDMDSVRADLPESAVRFPTHKDFTDTELAYDLLVDEGFRNIGILGGGGGRMDHFLLIWAMFHREPCPSIWVTDREEIRILRGETELHGVAGRRVSFFPSGTGPTEAVTEGLKWPLDGLVWGPGDGGVSNESVADRVKIHMIRGKLIMIQSNEGPRFHE